MSVLRIAPRRSASGSPRGSRSGLTGILLLAGVAGAAVGILGGQLAPTLVGGFVIAVALAASASLSLDKVSFALCALVVTFICWDGLRFGGGAIVDALMVLSFIWSVLLVVQARRPVPLPTWMVFAGAAMFVAVLATMAFSPSLRLEQSTSIFDAQESPIPALFPYRSNLSALFKAEVAVIVLPLVLVVNCTSRRRCRLLLDLFAAAAAISALVAILDFSGIAHLAARPLADSRSSGLTIHPNYLAFESAIALPLTLLWVGRDRIWRLAGPLGSAVLIGGVYVSGSRDASITAILAVVLMVAFEPRLRRRARDVIPLAGMLIVALLAFTTVGSRILHQIRLDPGDTTALASNSQRDLAADIAVVQIQARPISGVGFAVIEDAHDIYLELMAAGGVITLVGFGVYFAGLFRISGRALAGAQRPEATAAIASIIVWMVGGLFNNQVIDKFLYVVPGLLLAMSLIELPNSGTPIE